MYNCSPNPCLYNSLTTVHKKRAYLWRKFEHAYGKVKVHAMGVKWDAALNAAEGVSKQHVKQVKYYNIAHSYNQGLKNLGSQVN